MEIKIKENNSGKRLDIFLSEFDSKVSRSQWKKRIKAGGVLVLGKKRSPHYFLHSGDTIETIVLEEKISEKIDSVVKDYKVDVVFKGDNYVVVNKPAGMVTHRDDIHKDGTLVDWLVKKFPEAKGIGGVDERPGIVHRLDKEVSGLMVIALSEEMFEHLKSQFSSRKVSKEYVALVHNVMRQDEGEVNLPIKRSKNKGIFVAVSDFLSVFSKTKSALTEYEVLEKFNHYTLIKVNILTGRTHQIRVHMRSIGHPIVGDKVYITHDVKKKDKFVDLGRVWLYASKLSFSDLSGEWQEFECDVPKELKEFLKEIK